MYKKGDTFRIKTEFGYLSCIFGTNSWIILHPIAEEFDKVPNKNRSIRRFGKKIKKQSADFDIEENNNNFNSRIILIEKKIYN